MRALVRAKDWSSTPLGAYENWPQSLRTVVDLCIDNRFPTAIFWGPESILIYNDGYKPILAGKHPQALGQRAADCWVDVWPALKPLFDQVLLTGESTWNEETLFLIDRSGYLEEAYFTFSLAPIYNEKNEVAGIFNTVVEITKQTLAHRRMAVLRELGDVGVVKSVADVAIKVTQITDKHKEDFPYAEVYLFDEKNRAVRPASGKGSGGSFKLTDKDPWHFAEVLEDKHYLYLDDIKEIGSLSSGIGSVQIKSVIVLIIERPGATHPFGFFVAGLNPRRAFDENYQNFLQMTVQQIAKVMVMAETYQQESERAEELKRMNQELEAFSYSVSHDLRTPLRSIDGFSRVLLQEYGKLFDERAQNYFGRIRTATQRMGMLIDDLIHLSRITRANLNREKVNISNLAKTIFADLAIRSPERNVTARIADNLVVEGDPHLLTVMLENLLGNAWKFTSKHSEAWIEVGSYKEKDNTIFYVSDNGSGFAMEYANKLFSPFQRMHTQKEFEGTGIGLATVQRIVAKHGGRIWAEAVPDKGAKFFFVLEGGSL